MEGMAKMTRLEKIQVAEIFASLPKTVQAAFAAGEAMAEFRMQVQAEAETEKPA